METDRAVAEAQCLADIVNGIRNTRCVGIREGAEQSGINSKTFWEVCAARPRTLHNQTWHRLGRWMGVSPGSLRKRIWDLVDGKPESEAYPFEKYGTVPKTAGGAR